MTTIKLSMSTQVRFTCKSFLSCDSCLPFVLEFYNGTALEVSVSTHFIFNKKENEALYLKTFESRLTTLAVASINVLSSLPSVSDIRCDV